MKQKDIAEVLQVEGATVSQYISEKRANKITFNNALLAEIKQSTVRITNKLSMIREIQHLLRRVRETNTLCTIHHSISDLPENCTPAEMGCDVGGELGDEARTRICY